MKNTLYCMQNESTTCFRQVIKSTYDKARACECGISCEGVKYVKPEDLRKLPIDQRLSIARKIWASHKTTTHPNTIALTA